VIVRILGEGQFRLDDDSAAKLTVLDKDLDAAVHAGDESVFKMALAEAIKLVRQVGQPVPDDEFVTADYILPFSDASLLEVRKLLTDGWSIQGDPTAP
jgi:hypothetical protein